MLGLTLAPAKANFFDRQKVRSAMDDATRRVLSRFGAYVRQRARTSIRKRRGASAPGSPPHSHVGLLRRGILFAYDARTRSVVVGPFLLRPGSRAPNLLEYGGFAVVTDDQGRRRRAYYRARPYMRPAFQAELSRLPDQWKGKLRAR